MESKTNNEVCETGTIEMNVTTGKFILHTCPGCGETFEHPCIDSTSYGEEYEYCPYCEVHLRAVFYEVAK